MYSGLGQLFKELRKSKRLPLRTAAGDILSKSQLERFEAGENDIPASKLFALLEAINVSPEEYVIMLRDYRLDVETGFFEQLGAYEGTGDFNGLFALYQSAQRRFANNHQATARIDALAVKAILAAHAKSEPLTASERDYLTTFLGGVRQWGSYELNVYICLQRELDYQTCLDFAGKILRRSGLYATVPEHRRLVYMALQNAAQRAIQNHDSTNARRLLKHWSQLIAEHGSVEQRLAYSVLLAELAEKQGDYSKAADILADVAQTYERFGNHFLATGYRQQWRLLQEEIAQAKAERAETGSEGFKREQPGRPDSRQPAAAD